MNYSIKEVKRHNTIEDCWLIAHNKVYDVTKYMDKHPGGKEAILKYAGKDATEAFYQIHEKYMLDDLKAIGIIQK